MNKDRLKILIKNLEVLLENLKTEVYADRDAYMRKEESEFGFRFEGRDDDDGYPD